MAVLTLSLALALPSAAETRSDEVRVVNDSEGSRLEVNGRPMMVCGMNWGWIPIGHNYSFNLWDQPDEVIIEALSRDMPLLRDMGVNAIRQLVGIQPRWIEYIYRNYGIYTIINHYIGMYGYTIDGVWTPSVDYSDKRFREVVTADVLQSAEAYSGVPGVLMWLLGNENNYGLHWTSFEIEALPEGQRDAARARYLYSLYREITGGIKEKDPGRVVAISNGDIQYLDLIAEECTNLDIFGTNVYRGISARDLFARVKDALGIPVIFTEFGADAWNAKEMREDQKAQARYLHGQWQEIYEQSSGKGRVGNAIGGIIFQWTDGWWKFGQSSRLDIHDTNASWPNGGYVEDFVPGENNMNEEWWGITAKGPADDRGLFNVYPRLAYYVLKKDLSLDPYAPSTDIAAIREHFGAVDPSSSVFEARRERASLLAEKHEKVRLSGVRMHYVTYNTGGDKITTPEEGSSSTSFPSFQGFDQLQSFYAEFEAKPVESVVGNFSVNILGHVPLNPIDEIFYENRGRPLRVVGLRDELEIIELQGIERVKVYQGSVTWDDRWFLLDGFYRTGHTHWGYDGDLFGLYRDAYYGENIDIYNGAAPVGFEITGKKKLKGLKAAFGPQLWWGANPALLLKYDRKIGFVDMTAIFQEDLSRQSAVTSTIAIPTPETRKFTIALKASRGAAVLELGGIIAGTPRVGEEFQILSEDETLVLQDEVRDGDVFGAKGKLTVEKGRWHWYLQGAYMGLVADGGPTQATTFTGWTLKDCGSGNQVNAMTGLAVDVGRFQFSPNVLWQKPIVGPIPSDAPSPAVPRNILDDPFAVRDNREMLGAEFMITYDPEPATWMWDWDNDTRENARLAASIGYVYKHHMTTQDVAIGIYSDGITTFPFPGAPPARDIGEVNARIVSVIGNDFRLVAHMYYGTNEPKGEDLRMIRRFGGDARVATGPVAIAAEAKFNDWGPYDYHRDFNLTFPIQLMGDISYTLGKPRWFGYPQTSIGIRGTWRSLDKYSPRFCPGYIYDIDNNLVCDPLASGGEGNEWEVRTYLNFAL
ncbi:MAG: glycosidase [Candidatus Krumholzibacteriota bacterium]|nr:glycosidase [Candidatus Krumholzibacteriota bacterium]